MENGLGNSRRLASKRYALDTQVDATHMPKSGGDIHTYYSRRVARLSKKGFLVFAHSARA